jgi:UDP-N-acetylglucosamine transferase subunit ALG13
MDEIAGRTSEEVVIQGVSGMTKTVNARAVGFVSDSEIERLYHAARVVVCHAGTGTLLNAIRHGKSPILVPRMKECGEHFDNHQVDFCEAIEREYGFRVVKDVSQLEVILLKESYNECTREERLNIAARTELIRNIRGYVDKLSDSVQKDS